MKKLENLGRAGRFFAAGETVSGPHALAAISRARVNRAAVIVSQSVWSRHEQYIKRCLGRLSAEFIEAPRGEPTIDGGLGVVAQVHSISPDLIIAIGGGSTIDLAKLVWFMYEKPEINLAGNRSMFPVSGLRSKLAGFVAVPTTYGTGSENSSAAVFQRAVDGHKNFIVGSELTPDIAVLDSVLAVDLPQSAAINGIMDAISHLIEGYVSKASNSTLRQISEGALTKLRTILTDCDFPEIIKNTENVNEFMAASSMAGIVQNISAPGLAHALSHYSAKYSINHGQACGYFLPLSIRYNSSDDNVKATYSRLAAGSGFGSTEYLHDWLLDLNDKFELSKNIPSAAAFRESFDVDTFFADPTASMNPVTIDTGALFEAMDYHSCR